MLLILVRWILHSFQNHVSQYHLATFVFEVICLQFGIFQMTDVHRWSKMNLCALRSCFIDHLFFTSDFRQVPRQNLLPISPIPYPQGQWNKFLVIFWHYRVWVFHLSTFAFPSAGHFFPVWSRALAINDLAWMLTAVLSVSPWTTNISLESFSLLRVNWVKPVQNQKSLLIHRCCKNHWCGALA